MASPHVIAGEAFTRSIFPSGLFGDVAVNLVSRRLLKPGRGREDFSLPVEIWWEAEERSEDRNWRMQLQGWAMFHPILSVFDGSDQKDRIVAYFFGVARSWWRQYGADPVVVASGPMPSSYAWYDMSVGFRALVLAFFADRISAHDLGISAEERELLDALAAKHIASLEAEETFSLNSHGILQSHGLMALAQTFPGLGDAERAKHRALEMMVAVLDDQFDSNGLHREHSPDYHFYVLKTFEAVAKSGWYDSSEIAHIIAKARSMNKWLVDPAKRPVCIGDSILTEQDAVEFPDSGDEVILSQFDDSGYAVLRSGWAVPAKSAAMVFLMGAFHSKTHKHRDCLSFEWFDRGRRLLCDGGKYGYRDDKYRRYCLAGKAHNSVEIEGFDILKMKPYGSAIIEPVSLGDGVYRLSGAFNYAAISHKRHLYVTPGEWIVVIDELKYARARNSVQWFHLHSDFQLVSSAGRSVVAKDRRGQFVYLDCLDANAACGMHLGDVDRMQGFISEKDNEMTPALTVGFSVHGDAHRIVTCISLDALSRNAALTFAARFVDSGAVDVVDPTAPTQRESVISGTPHKVLADEKAIEPLSGKATYCCVTNSVEVNFFYDRKAAKKLLVMLPGASKRSHGHIDFQRRTWSEDFPQHDVLVFTDPTLRPTNDIGLAWFQHSKDHYGLAAIASTIRRLIAATGHAETDITFFGSSAGGFGALQLAGVFPEASAIAFNPQIYLHKYTRSFFRAMLATCYPGMKESEVIEQFPDRITVKIDPDLRKGKIYIFQNTCDETHLVRHLQPLLQTVEHQAFLQADLDANPAAFGKINVVYFTDPALGHSPPSRETTVSMVQKLL
jgi:pimeloyl-ACP methyl ester carboxylesterase